MIAELYATPLRTLIQNRHNCADHISPNLQRYRRTVFLQYRRMISPSRRHVFAKNRQISLLQIAEHVSSKSPTYFATLFLQIAEHFSPNLQDISPISEQHTFCSILFGDDPVSDLSLHVPRIPCSTLLVVSCGSLVTPVPPTSPRASRSTLWTMG